MTLLSVLIFLFWLICGLDFVRGVGFKIPRLKKTSAALVSYPKISILFAARNEGRQIERALKSMLAQDYPNFEVVAVNDRSTDDTLAVMQSFAASPHLRILNLTELPAGWLGKNHALYKASQVASGDWLLFTDADVVFDPATLRSVMALVTQKGMDHMALIPHMETGGFLEKIYTVCFGLGFFIYFRPWEASNPKSKVYMGIGAFNLVRRHTYQKIGGHQSFALNVLDDMELGRRIKTAGFRQQVVFGHELLSVRWVEGWQGILKSLEKNGFAGVDYRTGFLLVSTVFSVLFNVLPFMLLFLSQGLVQALSLASVLLIFFVFVAVQRFHPRSLLAFPFYPLGCLLVFGVLWRSAFLALRTGGIRWRDTFYPLEQLRPPK